VSTTVESRPSVNDLVNEALTRWLKLTKLVFDEEGRVESKANNCPWKSYELGGLTESLNESRDLDPTGLTTFMMLRGMAESYFREIKYDAETLILKPDSIESDLVPMRAVRDVLENPDVVQLIGDFQKMIRNAALHYGVQPGKAMDALEELLADKYSLAIVRRDALLSSRRLEVHQFSHGRADLLPPKYSPHVYEFWNVNSLLQAMRAQKFGGISIVLIRDPEEALNSYFIFALKNGFTFSILTDMEKGPHPAYKRMSRRPDRNMERRAAQNWFPYDLLDVKEIKNELGETERLVANVRTQLVPINMEAVAIKPLNELSPEQFVWTILMFDLIRDRFWAKNERLPELSYTGQMVVEPQALVSREGSLYKEGLYKPLELPRLTKEDVTEEKTKDQWGRESTQFNAWMVERYGHLVPEEVLNPVGEQAKLLLESRADELLPVTQVERVKNYGGEREIERPKFETLDPTSFGRKAEIERDRVWVGRMNQMKAIQRFADDEFNREKDKILEWYLTALKKNSEALFNACARGELALTAWITKHGHVFDGKEFRELAPSLNQGEGTTWSKAHGHYGFRRPKVVLGEMVTEEVPSRGRGWIYHRTREVHQQMCAERPNVRATIFTVIKVTCPAAIATVCGVKIEELPWPLQYWYNDVPYYGNSILDRLDPADWVLKNPWMDNHWRSTGLKLDVGVAHCKLAFNARRKALGLPPKIWEKPKDDDE
jgi:hypothetical protein